MINRGQILEAYVRKEQVNLTQLAEKLPWTVKTIYRHFEDDDLPYDKLIEYARALKYDFAEELPGLQPLLKVFQEPVAAYKDQSEGTDNNYYRRKYEEVLEKYNDMLEVHNHFLRSIIETQARGKA